jgi:hypothetical protein
MAAESGVKLAMVPPELVSVGHRSVSRNGATVAAGSLSHSKSDVSDFEHFVMPNSGKPEFGRERDGVRG